MNVIPNEPLEVRNLNEISIVAALKKRAMVLMDEETFKLVLQLEQLLKPNCLSDPLPPRPKRPSMLLKCEEKLRQKKNLSLDASSSTEIFFDTKEKPTFKDETENLGSRCKDVEKSFNLLNEKFQTNLDQKDLAIKELTEKNVRLREQNKALKGELKDGQENCTKMVKLFEQRLRERGNPFVDKTREVVNFERFREKGFSLNEYFSPKLETVSEKTSPMNFLAMGKSRRLLSFGDENRY